MDKLKLHASIRTLLNHFDKEGEREGTRETPARVIKAFEFWTSGYKQDPKEILKEFEDGAQNYDQMVFEGGISIYSLCEHHLTPFFGVAHIGYIPNKRIVGISKLARLAEMFARRFQVQERLTTQIADAIQEHLNPIGVGVVLRCRHLCMESRGVQKTGTVTYTSALRGAIKDEPETREEFLRFVSLADARTGNI